MSLPTSFANKLKEWRADLSEKRAMLEALPRIIDLSIEVLKHTGHPAFKWGVLAEVVSASRFTQITAERRRDFRMEAPPIQKPDDQSKEDRKEAKALYASYCAATAHVRTEIINMLPGALLEPLKISDSLATVRTKTIVETLATELATLNEDDFDAIRADLCAPYQDGQSIRSILAEQVTRNLRVLREHGQPLSDIDAVRCIQSKFNPITFDDCWKDYARTNGPISSKTPSSLVAAIIIFVNERMRIGRPVPNVALSTVTTEPNYAALVAEIAELKRNLGKQEERDKKRSRKPHYCWTHGLCAHSSKDCENDNPAHKREATIDKRMGGSNKGCPKRT
jgi:hypothetical protein